MEHRHVHGHSEGADTEPLSFTVIAGPRKGALIELLDELGLWGGCWETSEATLEERLMRHSAEKHREFVEQHGAREEDEGDQSDGNPP